MAKTTKTETTTKSKGLGDTIEKITEATGIKAVVKAIAGEDCGCDERKDWLNKKFPYKKVQCLDPEEKEYLSRWNPEGEENKQGRSGDDS